MKGCILLQGNYAAFGHAIAQVLTQSQITDSFCAYVISERATHFSKHLPEGSYTHILYDHELQAQCADEILDKEYLNMMEERFGNPTFWPYLYTDRLMMMSMKNMDAKTSVLKPLFNHDMLQRAVQVRLKAIISFLEKERPDFIVFFSMGQLGHQLLYFVAQKMGITVLNTEWLRIGSKVTFTRDYKTISGVKETAASLDRIEDASFLNQAESIIDRFCTTGNLDLEHVVYDRPRPISLWHRLRTYWTIFCEYHRHKQFYPDSYNIPASLSYFAKTKFTHLVRRWSQISKKADTFDSTVPYAFYPLHYEPEASILNIAPYYTNQLEVVQAVAKSLPISFTLYVKEHPNMVNKRERRFYKALRRIPNVVLLDPNISSFELIQHAKLVIVISGTAGWEAALLGKPVITFSDVFFNELSGVTKIHALEDLAEAIHQKLHSQGTPMNERISYVAAMLKNGSVDIHFFDMEHLSYSQIKIDPSVRACADIITRRVTRSKHKTLL